MTTEMVIQQTDILRKVVEEAGDNLKVETVDFVVDEIETLLYNLEDLLDDPMNELIQEFAKFRISSLVALVDRKNNEAKRRKLLKGLIKFSTVVADVLCPGVGSQITRMIAQAVGAILE